MKRQIPLQAIFVLLYTKHVQQATGIEPASSAWKADILAFVRCLHKQDTGIEPASQAWEARILPMY